MIHIVFLLLSASPLQRQPPPFTIPPMKSARGYDMAPPFLDEMRFADAAILRRGHALNSPERGCVWAQAGATYAMAILVTNWPTDFVSAPTLREMEAHLHPMMGLSYIHITEDAHAVFLVQAAKHCRSADAHKLGQLQKDIIADMTEDVSERTAEYLRALARARPAAVTDGIQPSMLALSDGEGIALGVFIAVLVAPEIMAFEAPLLARALAEAGR